MKGNPQIIELLNELLAHELAVINQYIVHSEICSNWGYDRLHDINEHRAIDEMKHAEKLIGRILFFEGIPIVNNLDPIKTPTNNHKTKSETSFFESLISPFFL